MQHFNMPWSFCNVGVRFFVFNGLMDSFNRLRLKTLVPFALYFMAQTSKGTLESSLGGISCLVRSLCTYLKSITFMIAATTTDLFAMTLLRAATAQTLQRDSDGGGPSKSQRGNQECLCRDFTAFAFIRANKNSDHM
jgi:hypothetical protein